MNFGLLLSQCAWSVASWDEGNAPLLAVAGHLGIIRVLDVGRQVTSSYGNSFLSFGPDFYGTDLNLQRSNPRKKSNSIKITTEMLDIACNIHFV